MVQHDGDEVRPPLPVIREALYDDIMLYGYDFSLRFGSFHSILRNRILALSFSYLLHRMPRGILLQLFFFFFNILEFCSLLNGGVKL